MCAPGDQRKSRGDQREQAELNTLRSAAGQMFREGNDLVRQAANLRRSCAEGSVAQWAVMEPTAFGGVLNWSAQSNSLLAKMGCGHELVTSHLLLGGSAV
jgi:hypothetical protein